MPAALVPIRLPATTFCVAPRDRGDATDDADAALILIPSVRLPEIRFPSRESAAPSCPSVPIKARRRAFDIDANIVAPCQGAGDVGADVVALHDGAIGAIRLFKVGDEDARAALVVLLEMMFRAAATEPPIVVLGAESIDDTVIRIAEAGRRHAVGRQADDVAGDQRCRPRKHTARARSRRR